jgi:hypothetical protein
MGSDEKFVKIKVNTELWQKFRVVCLKENKSIQDKIDDILWKEIWKNEREEPNGQTGGQVS